MPRYAYDRLSAQDNMFLVAETANTPMHIAAVQVVETGDLANSDGGVDIARYKRALESVLHLIPRYRQKLRYIPVQNRPVWVDDRFFSLDYHVRHSALPKPGTLDQLKALCSRIMSNSLDRARPLWEIWIVEGVQGGEQFAIVSKIHHCMIDGSAGADLAQILASPDPAAEIGEPVPYIPRPAPATGELLRDELAQRALAPVRGLARLRQWWQDAEAPWSEVEQRVGAMTDLVRQTVNGSSETPINGRLGPHRRFDWLTMPLDDVRDVKRVLGATVNDVVLATVAGAVRHYLARRRVDPSGLDFRVSAPVNVRTAKDAGKMGNFVSSWIVPLPLHLETPEERLAAVRESTRELKASRGALGVEMLMAAAEWLPDAAIRVASRAAAGPVNMIVTNVPGPQFPLYQLGAKLLGTYPMVPCMPDSGLGVALFSYDGRLCWGFNADPERVPDLPVFVEAIKGAFEELRTLAASRVTEPRRKVADESAGRRKRGGARSTAKVPEAPEPLAAAAQDPNAPSGDRVVPISARR
jgi:WS/DGAT/MGAT family acyltransferase